MGSLDEAGNIGDYEAHFVLGITYGNDSQVRLEGGEGVVGDFGTRRRDAGDQSRLADVRISDKTDIGEQLQLETVSVLFAGTPFLVLARGLVDRGGKTCVAASAASAAGNHETLVGMRELEKLVAGLVVEDDRADGNF